MYKQFILSVAATLLCVPLCQPAFAQAVVCQSQSTFEKRVYNYGVCPAGTIRLSQNTQRSVVDLTGMLSQINQQMAPRQAAPQIPVEQQNLMQRFGITNDPMLERFGQGLGNALGVETRSQRQMALDKLQRLDLTTKSGLTEAAKVYMSIGEHDTAMRLLQLAQ